MRRPAQDMFSFWAFPIDRERSQLVFGLEGSMMVRTLREPHLACIQVVLHKEHALLTSVSELALPVHASSGEDRRRRSFQPI